MHCWLFFVSGNTIIAAAGGDVVREYPLFFDVQLAGTFRNIDVFFRGGVKGRTEAYRRGL